MESLPTPVESNTHVAPSSILDKTADDYDVFLSIYMEGEKLKLAKIVLLGLAIIFVLSGFAHIVTPTRGGVIFETCKSLLPPIATLILGYYFAEKAK